MVSTFTITEYIKMHKLDVSPKDSGATRLIAAHLRSKGYVRKKVRRNGVSEWVWTNQKDTHLDKLKEKLKGI